MSVQFSEIEITNRNGVEIEVMLEVPAGISITGGKIPPRRADEEGKSKKFSINKDNIQSAKIVIKASGHEDYPDIMLLDIGKSGTPYPIYIEKINASTSIGSIHGTAVVNF